MGLKYPVDLDGWRKWQENTDKVRWAKQMVKNLLKKTEPSEVSLEGFLYTRGTNPALLVALDSTSPTTLMSLVKPIEYFEGAVAVWSPVQLEDLLPGSASDWKISKTVGIDFDLADLKLILSTGHYLPYGGAAYELAHKKNLEYVVVQHGLMTPFAPPLPSGATLFAFSQADADFWISGRKDIESEVVGSQLFYEALQQPKVAAEDIEETPIFLGQMHGAELPRLSFARASFDIVKNHGAIYRPHPSEKDKLSLMTHKLWAKMGATIDRSSSPLNQLNNPVVSVFSTGVLEAAIRGIPAWVYHPNPPAWLVEFWDRYGMSRWGSEPTPAPAKPDVEPAKVIAQKIAQKLEK